MPTKPHISPSDKEKAYSAIAGLILENDRERANRVKSAHPDLANLFDDAKERAVFLKASGIFTISGYSKQSLIKVVCSDISYDPNETPIALRLVGSITTTIATDFSINVAMAGQTIPPGTLLTDQNVLLILHIGTDNTTITMKYGDRVVGYLQGDPDYSFSDFNPSPGIAKITQANG
ncbi:MULTISPECIES: hypothetical protein [Burkholderia]|uniref:Uncharacterized protein n=1 Tax=Burkholderia pyrrocinia TaxID=60550 RepID=A0A318HT83_BURPY|nr:MULTISPECIES: hypothetical protein [Burkholderia]PXX21684.1 hypothetical protein NA66_10462 [Burkholderia pyrrocinia]SFW90310.1 hypothetical protein SAMN03159384_06986 [Burkholderia sp. NFACC33-1]SFY46445.1 hypothetical protein SAMN03159408_06982 [Burkholderia sp. NFPP32]